MTKFIYPLGILAFIIFIILRISLESSWVTLMDTEASNWLRGNAFIQSFHYLGEHSFILCISVLLMIWLWLRASNYRGMMFALLTIGAGNILNQLLKKWVQRDRPDIPDQLATFSFPSNHAMMSVLFLFTLTYFATEDKKKTLGTSIIWLLAVFLSILIGLSRIAESRHFASDIIAGWAIGYTWFVLVRAWYERRKHINKKLEQSNRQQKRYI
ncbi:phosphatase PAP2 family protein [Rummeliibacillus stabekisii]|uniref:Phosphatidylglycerophosphatase n=1 Tax=Rummeliibacillus stabekisii TaxID=241244 RepID=A0A143HFF4_9BACL|nr:phosphatase PAP2 family protein [Rummeliibacillus stabekisii]AMX00216.1 phosphatidylglycerophosphatase [Rummeliibacillus stabekisii]